MTSRFRIPTGESRELDDPAPLLAAILEKGAEFWNIGSGDAAVEKGSANNPLMLELYFDGQDRFQLRHTPPGEWSVTAQDPAHGGDKAVINVGGTPMNLASGTLLSRADAARIARHFFDTGEKHPDFEWR